MARRKSTWAVLLAILIAAALGCSSDDDDKSDAGIGSSVDGDVGGSGDDGSTSIVGVRSCWLGCDLGNPEDSYGACKLIRDDAACDTWAAQPRNACDGTAYKEVLPGTCDERYTPDWYDPRWD